MTESASLKRLRGGSAGQPDLQNFVPNKTPNIWVSFPSVRELLARCIFVQKPAFYHAFARCFLRRAGFSGPKKDGYFSASPCLLAYCLRVSHLDLPLGMLGVLAAQPVRMLRMLEPVSRCSFALIRAVSWRVHGSFFV